jgi:hypothetical protein
MDTLLEKNEFLEYESRFTEYEIENNTSNGGIKI